MLIRKAVLTDAASIANVHVDCWRTTYRGILPEAALNKLSYEKRASLWEYNIREEKVCIYVAENENGQVVGFASGSKRDTNKNPEAGDLTSIYILENEQGKGIGNHLVKMIFQDLQKMGCKSIYVEVLAENNSKGFYDYLGAKLFQEEQMSIMGTDVDVLIYKWESVESI
ncbi:GNAT family N-acetyltransferase [Alkalicoccobacillus plakortidis]|uniref:GNAT family N-acetyltransferase n=1 Tax=Alkalicoccobacillus plakortidis TaxID=444060 RepID=A0ABT0XQR5_9BACI|nr:GNAT family N-acetyltransferase [Alkalicoccobacillus plakortidis]MCM2677594.1 GNAT family N-acetyltransferase [Alkalicoccobacillus plakortidis]